MRVYKDIIYQFSNVNMQINRLFIEEFGSSGKNPIEVKILISLTEGEINIKDLSKLLLLKPKRLYKIIRKMEYEGLVKIGTTIALTSKGRQLGEDFKTRYERINMEVLNVLSEDEFEFLEVVLKKIEKHNSNLLYEKVNVAEYDFDYGNLSPDEFLNQLDYYGIEPEKFLKKMEEFEVGKRDLYAMQNFKNMNPMEFIEFKARSKSKLENIYDEIDMAGIDENEFYNHMKSHGLNIMDLENLDTFEKFKDHHMDRFNKDSLNDKEERDGRYLYKDDRIYREIR